MQERFHEKFVEFAPDGSSWGAGLRIRHTGTTEDREILDEIKSFIQQEIAIAVAEERERIFNSEILRMGDFFMNEESLKQLIQYKLKEQINSLEK